MYLVYALILILLLISIVAFCVWRYRISSFTLNTQQPIQNGKCYNTNLTWNPDPTSNSNNISINI